jgi:hypothetical protein
MFRFVVEQQSFINRGDMDAITPPFEVSASAPASASLPRATIFVMSAACVASVANIYYNQPLLQGIADYFHQSIARAGMLATAAQVECGAELRLLSWDLGSALAG